MIDFGRPCRMVDGSGDDWIAVDVPFRGFSEEACDLGKWIRFETALEPSTCRVERVGGAVSGWVARGDYVVIGKLKACYL